MCIRCVVFHSRLNRSKWQVVCWVVRCSPAEHRRLQGHYAQRCGRIVKRNLVASEKNIFGRKLSIHQLGGSIATGVHTFRNHKMLRWLMASALVVRILFLAILFLNGTACILVNCTERGSRAVECRIFIQSRCKHSWTLRLHTQHTQCLACY